MANSVFDCMTDEAKRRNYDAIADQVRRCAEAAVARCVGHEAAVAEEATRHQVVMPVAVAEEATRHQVVMPVEIKPAPVRELFAFDADEPARLRRAFASWDFSNGT